MKTLDKLRRTIETELKKAFASLEDCPRELKKSMEYAVFSGGKRLRPLLCLLAYSASRGRRLQECLPFACGIELIHTFSLIHDDLPAIDNEEFRRGKPTLHRVFGEGMAILAADSLFALAFETFLKGIANTRDGKSARLKLSALNEIISAVGPRGMVGGQVLDIRQKGRQSYLLTVRKKTASLITASLLAGAIIAGCSKRKLALLRAAGHALGTLFQLTDDILDRDGAVKVYGLKKTTALKATSLKKARRLFEGLGKGFEPFVQLVDLIAQRAERSLGRKRCERSHGRERSERK